MEKRNYKNEKLNKEKIFFYDERENVTAIIEKINTYSNKNRDKNVVCVTYAYDDNGNNILIYDQGTKYTFNYDGNKLTNIKVGDKEIISYYNNDLGKEQQITDYGTNIEGQKVLSKNEEINKYGNGQKIRKVTTILSNKEDLEAEDLNKVCRRVELFYDSNTEASYIIEYNRNDEIIQFLDKENSNGEIKYIYEKESNKTTIKRDDGFSITEEKDLNSDETVSSDILTYRYIDVLGTMKSMKWTATINLGNKNTSLRTAELFDGNFSTKSCNSISKYSTNTIYSNELGKNLYYTVLDEKSSNKKTYSIQSGGVTDKIYYSFDEVGNLVKVTKDTDVLVEYEYDGHGRLRTEINYEERIKHTYSYNNTGNMIAEKKYNILDNGEIQTDEDSFLTKSFSYSQTDWPDQMVKYNGEEIIYDDMGNAVSYRDAMKLSWVRGRILKDVDKNGVNVASYEYDSENLRVKKEDMKEKVKYEWTNQNLTREFINYKETNEKYDIWFQYDADGEIIGFIYSKIGDNNQKETRSIYYKKIGREML